MQKFVKRVKFCTLLILSVIGAVMVDFGFNALLNSLNTCFENRKKLSCHHTSLLKESLVQSVCTSSLFDGLLAIFQ